MLQRTMLTEDYHDFLKKLNEWQKDESIKRASSQLILFSDQKDDASHLRDEVEAIRALMPDACVLGITVSKNSMMKEFSGRDMAGFSLITMEKSVVELLYFDIKKYGSREAGRMLAKEIESRPLVAGVMLFSAGMEKEIDAFLLAMAGGDRFDVPIIGAQAAAANNPFICGSFGEMTESLGVAALVFSGEGLRMFYNYDMGWRAIGKEMRVTDTDGRYCIRTIDGEPAASIYQKYLGVEPDEYFVENVREFPFVVKRGDREVVRTPSGTDEEGNLKFIARIKPDEVLRLSYGNLTRLLEDVNLYADLMRDFEPEALILIECENRIRFLGDNSDRDIACYWSFMPQVTWVRGYAAIMMDKQGGGVVNSSILSVGFREGDVSGADIDRGFYLPPPVKKSGAIPMDRRLAMFLEQTTKELEEMAVSARLANTAKSAFLSQMSHEIRTPINAVIGMNEMILRESENPLVLQYAQNARNAGINLLSIISDILDFSKIEAGRMEINDYEYELASLIGDLVNLIRLRAEEKGLEFVVKVNPQTPYMLKGDELRIKQIITNLLTNAVKYTERGRVEWRVDFEEGAKEDEIILKIEVKDTGIGIKKENIARLFTAFDRIDKERTRLIEGTGLGINITQQLLSLMGSKLEVYSEHNKGSVFSFLLAQKVVDRTGIGDYDTAIEKVTKQRVARRTEFTAKSARILVVDDAPMNLAVMTGLLKRTKMQVDTASSGRECIEKFGDRKYDLVFLDHRMPGMDGIETLQEMKRIYGNDLKNTPVISLTANAISGAREEYLAAGFSDYLTKPVIAEDLEAMILRYLPKTKVAEGEDEEAEEADESKLPLWLLKVGLLHPHNGLKYCGGAEEYLEARNIFSASIDERADELERIYQLKDWNDYNIKIHALKTMTRSIGADELSELARTLEKSSDELDTSAIRAGHNIFISLYRAMKGYLAPLSKDDDAENEEDVREGIMAEKKRILLVDDDNDFLMLLSRWLGKEYEVSTANSGEEALSYLKKERVDLVLLDFYMPQMDGPDTLKKLRENVSAKDLAVVFLSGTDDEDNMARAKEYNPRGFFPKTLGKAALLKRVAELLG